MSDIFISYASANRPFALQIAERLEQFYTVWIDREGIDGGMQWENAIMQAVTDCTVFIVIVTPESNQSEWVARETILAEKLKKQRVPILLSGELPFRLLNLHYIDFQGEFEGGFRDLLEALRPHLQPQDKTREAVNQLLGEAIRAQLVGDAPTARNLIGQALTIQADLADDVESFWAQLQATPKTDYATLVQSFDGLIHKLVQQHARIVDGSAYGYDDDAYEWFLTIDASDAILDQIEFVRYRLHTTFMNPDRVIRDRKSQFLLRFVGWGAFDIPVKIQFKDGSTLRTSISLEFPD